MKAISNISNRTDKYIHEYQEVSYHQGLHGWDPRLKLALLVIAVAMNVVVARLWLSFLLFLISLGLVIRSRVPWRLFALFFLAPAWATLIVFLGFSAGFGTTAIATIGPLSFYQEGMLQGLSAAARVACDMSWMAAVFLTTPFTKVLKALKWYRIPDVLLDMIAMAYRYAFFLFDEFLKMKDAARSRGGFQSYYDKCRSTAMILAQVIIRAYDRAQRIQEAMVARGESGSEEDNMNEAATTQSCPNQCDITPRQIDGLVPILSCRDLSYAYYRQNTLRGVSLTIKKGEVVVLCGPNGAGKTTLLRLFAGVLSPDGGDIFLCGHRLDRQSRNNAFHYAGILYQDPNDQLFCTHVREDIAYGPTNLGLEDQEVERLVQTAMDLMEVSHLAQRPIHRLSHGEMKRVGLAGLIAMRPPLLLLDEPSASLDPAATHHLVHLIKHLHSHHGYTLVIVTHDINIAALIAERIIILDQGEIIADGTAREVLTDKRLLETSRLEPPILTKLFQQLFDDSARRDQIPITIEEAVKLLNGFGKHTRHKQSRIKAI